MNPLRPVQPPVIVSPEASLERELHAIRSKTQLPFELNDRIRKLTKRIQNQDVRIDSESATQLSEIIAGLSAVLASQTTPGDKLRK